jgi:chromosome partitioning protein
MAVTIALLNMKGGVGKTVLAVNLASHFFKNEETSVLLVDLDPQFNATQYVMDYKSFSDHKKNAGTISDLLIDQPQLTPALRKKKKDPSTVLYSVRREGERRLDLLPAELSLAWLVKNPAQMDFKLEKVLQKLRGRYDYVFVDCAPTDSVLTTMALMASDYLLIPMRPDRFSILGFSNLVETIGIFRNNSQDPHSVKIIGIVYTQVQGNSDVEEKAILEIDAAAQKEGTYRFKSALGFSKSYIRSINDQTPIFETLYAKPAVRTATAKIATELKERIEDIKDGKDEAK